MFKKVILGVAFCSVLLSNVESSERLQQTVNNQQEQNTLTQEQLDNICKTLEEQNSEFISLDMEENLYNKYGSISVTNMKEAGYKKLNAYEYLVLKLLLKIITNVPNIVSKTGNFIRIMDCNYNHFSDNMRDSLQHFLEHKRYDLFITQDGGLAISLKEVNNFIFGPMHNSIDNSKLIDELYYIINDYNYNYSDKLSRIMNNKKFQVLNSTLSNGLNNFTQLIKDIIADTKRDAQDKCALLQTLLSVYEYSEKTLENYKPFYNNKDKGKLNKNMNNIKTGKKYTSAFPNELIDMLKNIYKLVQEDIQKAIDNLNAFNGYSITSKATLDQEPSISKDNNV